MGHGHTKTCESWEGDLLARKDSVGVEGRGRKDLEDDENISYICMELSSNKTLLFLKARGSSSVSSFPSCISYAALDLVAP